MRRHPGNGFYGTGLACAVLNHAQIVTGSPKIGLISLETHRCETESPELSKTDISNFGRSLRPTPAVGTKAMAVRKIC